MDSKTSHSKCQEKLVEIMETVNFLQSWQSNGKNEILKYNPGWQGAVCGGVTHFPAQLHLSLTLQEANTALCSAGLSEGKAFL